MLHRLALTLLTIFFPPATVLLITGPYTDTLINCILFLCGVIPSHIHAFYISCTYFHRKKKVRKGKWPGGPKALIFDEKVWNGGASEAEVEVLRRERGNGKRRGKGKGDRRSRGEGVGGYDGAGVHGGEKRRSGSVGVGGGGSVGEYY